MRRFLLIPTLIFAFISLKAATPTKEDFITLLEGTYIELFSQKTCLNPQLVGLWKSEATKYVGEDNAQNALSKLIRGCQGKAIGQSAINAFKTTGNMQFDCSFKQGVEKFVFEGNKITGFDKSEEEIFSHNYHFLKMDSDGNYLYESDDDNIDEFKYFWFRPDCPKETFHIEFRYGNDTEQLSSLMTGKYAFWMASAVREGQYDEHKRSIILFVKENLSENKE